MPDFNPDDFKAWFSRRDLAAAIGVPDATIAANIKKKAADLPDPIRLAPGQPLLIAPETAQFVAELMGLDWSQILQKMRTTSEAAPAAVPIGDVVEGRVISQLPNPIFWRVRVGNVVKTLRETRQNMRRRIKPGVVLRLRPTSSVDGYLEVVR